MFTTGTPLAALITKACCAPGAARLGMICACAVSGKASEAANEAARKTVNDAVSDVDTDTAINLKLEM